MQDTPHSSCKHSPICHPVSLHRAVLCCAVLCCAVLCCTARVVFYRHLSDYCPQQLTSLLLYDAMQTEKLARSSKLLSMYINRCNSGWAEAQKLSAPQLAGTAAEQASWQYHGDQMSIYRADVLRKLRQVGVWPLARGLRESVMCCVG